MGEGRMIISHKHRYLFVELPQTGSTAISRELCQHYGGQEILHKHATYGEFLKAADRNHGTYFVFSGIRNPLDNAVSTYFKCKTDHYGTYSSVSDRPTLSRFFFRKRTKGLEFIQKKDADFSSYFLKFYRYPYDNWSAVSHHKFDFIIRFERIAQDFSRVLQMIGLEQVRLLPVVHTTAEKQVDFASYYTPEAIRRAKHVFGPFMETWDYEFPTEWGSHSVSRMDLAEYEFLNLFRKLYWIFLRPYVQARLLHEREASSAGAEIRDTTRKSSL
jgi:hypothetical protein